MCLLIAIGLGRGAAAQVPDLINYQGLVTVGGSNYSGTGQFNFALVDPAGTTTYWSNDGTSVGGVRPANAVTLSVSGGSFNVMLGDTALPNMTAFPATVFTGHGDVRLRVWFNDGTHGTQLLSPDQRLLAGAYAIRAATADSLAAGASVPAVQITGTMGTVQLADGSVTKAKLSANGGSAGQVLGTDGTSLQWLSAGGSGTVTSITAGSGLTGGTITASGTIAVDPTAAVLTGNFYKLGGNAFGATAVLGTSDNNALELRVNGGRAMRIQPDPASPNMVGGGTSNSVGAFPGQTVAGGGRPTSDCVTPGSGTLRSCANLTNGSYSTVSGGLSNQTPSAYSVIAGGQSNSVNGDWGTVAGGYANATGLDALYGDIYNTIGGGRFNRVIGWGNTVAGGVSNYTMGWGTTVAGGGNNTASGYGATIAGGSDNTASGEGSTVVGGASNTAWASYALAAGRNAKAMAPGMFAWADSTPLSFDMTQWRGTQSSNDSFNVRATGQGGVIFVTQVNPTTGAPTWSCYTYAGGGWVCTSDRNVKRNLRRVDGQAVLAKLTRMPLYRWQPKTGPRAEVIHLGPMAQDFHAAFGLGDDDKAIGMQDAEGVALAAIQGLNSKVEAQATALRRQLEQKDAQLVAQAARIAELERDRRQQLARVDALERQAAGLTGLEQEVKRLARLQQPETPVIAFGARGSAR